MYGIIWTLVIAGILTVILTIAYNAVKAFLDYTHPAKKVTLETELPYFKEANTNDKEVGKGVTPKQSVAMQYEEMCINNPMAYEGQPVVKSVLKKYRDIVTGKTLDPSGDNIPSEFMNSERNHDYTRYLTNQWKALKAAGYTLKWIDLEMDRVKEARKDRALKGLFVKSLIEFGIPEDVIPYAVTEDRLENYTPQDWNKLKDTVKKYSEDFDVDNVCEYISLFEGDILHDYASMAKYNVLRDHEVEEHIAKYVVQGDVSEEQLYDILNLIDNKAYSSEDAILKVLSDRNKAYKVAQLRDEYRNKVKRSR